MALNRSRCPWTFGSGKTGRPSGVLGCREHAVGVCLVTIRTWTSLSSSSLLAHEDNRSFSRRIKRRMPRWCLASSGNIPLFVTAFLFFSFSILILSLFLFSLFCPSFSCFLFLPPSCSDFFPFFLTFLLSPWSCPFLRCPFKGSWSISGTCGIRSWSPLPTCFFHSSVS